MIQLESLATIDLLRLFARVLDQLRERGVIRSSNNPVADYAEGLVASALGLKLVPNSTTGYDAEDPQGNRYEIKGRRWTKHNRSTQLSVIRGLDLNHFSFLVGVLFNDDFSVERSCVIPRDVVLKVAVHRKHVNGWIIQLRPELMRASGVRDITDDVRRAQTSIAQTNGAESDHS